MSKYELLPNNLEGKITALPLIVERTLMCLRYAREFGFTVTDDDLARMKARAPTSISNRERLTVRLRAHGGTAIQTVRGHLDMIEMVCRETGLGFENHLEVDADHLRLASPLGNREAVCKWEMIEPQNYNHAYADELLALAWVNPEYICSRRSSDPLYLRGYDYYSQPAIGQASWDYVPLLVDSSHRAPGRICIAASDRQNAGRRHF